MKQLTPTEVLVKSFKLEDLASDHLNYFIQPNSHFEASVLVGDYVVRSAFKAVTFIDNDTGERITIHDQDSTGRVLTASPVNMGEQELVAYSLELPASLDALTEFFLALLVGDYAQVLSNEHNPKDYPLDDTTYSNLVSRHGSSDALKLYTELIDHSLPAAISTVVNDKLGITSGLMSVEYEFRVGSKIKFKLVPRLHSSYAWKIDLGEIDYATHPDRSLKCQLRDVLTCAYNTASATIVNLCHFNSMVDLAKRSPGGFQPTPYGFPPQGNYSAFDDLGRANRGTPQPMPEQNSFRRAPIHYNQFTVPAEGELHHHHIELSSAEVKEAVEGILRRDRLFNYQPHNNHPTIMIFDSTATKEYVASIVEVTEQNYRNKGL